MWTGLDVDCHKVGIQPPTAANNSGFADDMIRYLIKVLCNVPFQCDTYSFHKWQFKGDLWDARKDKNDALSKMQLPVLEK